MKKKILLFANKIKTTTNLIVYQVIKPRDYVSCAATSRLCCCWLQCSGSPADAEDCQHGSKMHVFRPFLHVAECSRRSISKTKYYYYDDGWCKSIFIWESFIIISINHIQFIHGVFLHHHDHDHDDLHVLNYLSYLFIIHKYLRQFRYSYWWGAGHVGVYKPFFMTSKKC